MDKGQWEGHQEFIVREKVGESVHISPDGKVTTKPWTQSQDPEEAVFHDTISPRSDQTKEQLELPLD